MRDINSQYRANALAHAGATHYHLRQDEGRDIKSILMENLLAAHLDSFNTRMTTSIK